MIIEAGNLEIIEEMMKKIPWKLADGDTEGELFGGSWEIVEDD